jgi:uncharacterized membrane protein YjdF
MRRSGFFLAVWYQIDDIRSLSNSAWIISLLMLANAMIMLFLAIVTARRRRGFYYLTLAVLAVNLLLTVTDEFGLLDLIVLILALAIVLLMVGARSQFMPSF